MQLGRGGKGMCLEVLPQFYQDWLENYKLVLPALLHLCNILLCGSNPMSGERRADYYPESKSKSKIYSWYKYRLFLSAGDVDKGHMLNM